MRLASSAQSMERRGVVAPSDGLIPVSVTVPRSNVRSDGLIPDASQKLKESQDVPDEDLRLLLNRARVSRWADHIVELGAICVEDVAMTSAEKLAPMPIMAAERLIRFAVEASKENATCDDQKPAGLLATLAQHPKAAPTLRWRRIPTPRLVPR